MATKRTWLWILAGGLGLIVFGMMAVAAFGVYFVASHVATSQTTSAAAHQALDTAREPFKNQKPLYEIDNRERLNVTRRLEDLPSGQKTPEQLWILAWDPEDQRLVKLSLPFWVLKLGRQKIDVMDGSGLDLERLQLDVNQLQRVGSMLVLDYQAPTGQRVIVWTQ